MEDIEALFDALQRPGMKERLGAANAIDKAAARHAGCVQPYKDLILEWMPRQEEWGVRAHACRLIPRLMLNSTERLAAFETVRGLATDKSNTRDTVERAASRGTPAMKARGRRLLSGMKKRAAL